mgnify:CR=1 FL=1
MRGLPDSVVVRNDAPSGAGPPSTVSARTPTMQRDSAGDLKSRPTADALTTIARADRAYHDVAQLHPHEFGDVRSGADLDHVHFHRAPMAQTFSGGSSGDQQ